MKFGIFYELSVPRPWDAEAERSVYMNALEQVRLADELRALNRSGRWSITFWQNTPAVRPPNFF